jgi:hypothetical protein
MVARNGLDGIQSAPERRDAVPGVSWLDGWAQEGHESNAQSRKIVSLSIPFSALRVSTMSGNCVAIAA